MKCEFRIADCEFKTEFVLNPQFEIRNSQFAI